MPSSISLAILLERTRTSHLSTYLSSGRTKENGRPHRRLHQRDKNKMLLSPSACCCMQTAPSAPSHVESAPTAVPKNKPGRTLLLLRYSAKNTAFPKGGALALAVNEHLRKTRPDRFRAGFCFCFGLQNAELGWVIIVSVTVSSFQSK